eukprot:3911555-Rhodomonas_salina.1
MLDAVRWRKDPVVLSSAMDGYSPDVRSACPAMPIISLSDPVDPVLPIGGGERPGPDDGASAIELTRCMSIGIEVLIRLC